MEDNIQAQDWPNLNKYKNENADLLSMNSGQKRIVFMGDSITEFWSTINPDFFNAFSICIVLLVYDFENNTITCIDKFAFFVFVSFAIINVQKTV